MKKSMSRDHAELLKLQYMSMDLSHDVILNLYNRKAHSREAFFRHNEQTESPPLHAANDGIHEPARRIDASKR